MPEPIITTLEEWQRQWIERVRKDIAFSIEKGDAIGWVYVAQGLLKEIDSQRAKLAEAQRMNRMFPVHPQDVMDYPWFPRSVSWELLASHEAQAQSNHGQSLERLAERGGLSWREIYAILTDLPYREVKKCEIHEIVEAIQCVSPKDKEL